MFVRQRQGGHLNAVLKGLDGAQGLGSRVYIIRASVAGGSPECGPERP